MFYVDNHPLLADDLTVLTELKHQLAINGIERFAQFKVGPNNIQFNCPIHNDGQERKPSCGISTTNNKDSQGRLIPAGTVHCFSCGYTATLEEMISHCFGKDDFGAFGKQWLLKNFLTVAVNERPDISLDLERKTVTDANKYVTEDELDSYRYYHPYMYKRKLTNEVINQFDIGYDANFRLDDKNDKSVVRCITFPVRDEQGRTLFIARRSVDTKLFHYPEGVLKPVYGLYELSQLDYMPDEVIVCESIINALTCYVYGKPAVALNGTGTDYQYEQLRNLNCRKLITALDPDKAGQMGTVKLKKALRGNKLVTSYVLPKGKDINDLSKEEFDNLQEVF